MHESNEADRIAGRAIARVGMVILLILAVTLLLLAWLARHYQADHPRFVPNYPVPPSPRIDPAPRAELDGYLATQRAHLEGYRRLDSTGDWAHIPIERAMALYAQQAATRGAR